MSMRHCSRCGLVKWSTDGFCSRCGAPLDAAEGLNTLLRGRGVVVCTFRAILGGLLGAPLFLIGNALHDKLEMGHVPYSGAFQVMALPMFLPIGAAAGALIGLIIWLVGSKAKIKLSLMKRAVIGMSLIFVVWGALNLILPHESRPGVILPTRARVATDLLIFALTCGALPGAMACSRGSAD